MTLPRTLHSLLAFTALALSAFVYASALQLPPHHVHARNDVARRGSHVLSTRDDHTTDTANATKVQFAYYVDWGTYSLNFQPADINPSTLTHILYAFARVNASDGHISLSDPYADELKAFPGDSASAWNDTKNLYGLLKQLYILKLNNRHLKLLLSIGGATYSTPAANPTYNFDFVANQTSRATFVSDVVQVIKDYGFDGIDIDYEFPDTTEVAAGFADLLTETRKGLDDLKEKKQDATPYLLTAAVSSGSSAYSVLDVKKMDAALDYWNLMAYDYAGAWSNVTGHQANLYGGNISTDQAIKWYTQHGATAHKINLGIPLYGRMFNGTDGLGKPFTNATGDSPGYFYKDLPHQGANVTEDKDNGASYSYDAAHHEFVSFDTPAIAAIKAKYVQDQGLAGSMFWDLSSDRNGSDSLVAVTAKVYGASLDRTENHVNFPDSKWENIRNNMGMGVVISSSESTSAPSSTSTSASTSVATSTVSSTAAFTTSTSLATISVSGFTSVSAISSASACACATS